MARVFALGLCLFADPARGEEPSHFDYALDELTELTLEPKVDDAKTWALDLRRYGSPEQGIALREMGDAHQVSPGVYECRSELERKVRIVTVTGQPGSGQAVSVTSKGLTTYADVAVEVSGEFVPLAPAQRLERAQQRWAKADAVLNQVYARVLAEVGKAGEAKLRQLQRREINDRDMHAEFDATDNREHPKESPNYWDTMLGFTTSNLQFLKIYTGRDVPKGLSGTYTDGFGGGLELEETPKGLKFSLTVVRGRSSHIGEISGVARLKDNRATFKALLSKEETKAGQKAAELTFTMSAGHLVHIDAKNAEDYGGMGAYFDGDYYKEGKLKKPIDLTKPE